MVVPLPRNTSSRLLKFDSNIESGPVGIGAFPSIQALRLRRRPSFCCCPVLKFIGAFPLIASPSKKLANSENRVIGRLLDSTGFSSRYNGIGRPEFPRLSDLFGRLAQSGLASRKNSLISGFKFFGVSDSVTRAQRGQGESTATLVIR